MYERMLNKKVIPSCEEIEEYVGEENYERLEKLETILSERYDLNRELKFPFGNSYGWGYKYSHRTKHLCYLFFEKDAITVTIQIGTNELEIFNRKFDSFLPKTQELWENRYLCGNGGGWIHYRILSDRELSDVLRLIAIKKMPVMV